MALAMGLVLAAPQAGEAGIALAGLGLASVPWSALPWREGAMLGVPLAGTAAGRIARRMRRR